MHIDFRVLLFTLGVSLLAGVLLGLIPALQAGRDNRLEGLQSRGVVDAGGGARRTQGLLVTLEVAVTLVLLIGASLLLQSWMRLRAVHPGFEPAGVLTTQIVLPDARYAQSHQRVDFYRRLLEQVGSLPGVDGAALVTTIPLRGGESVIDFVRQGRPAPTAAADTPFARFDSVSAEHLRVMRIPLLAGRPLRDSDHEQAPGAVLINQTLLNVDRNLPSSRLRSVDEVVSGSVAQPRFQSFLSAAFAVAALFLALVGLYGVLSFLVSRRVREIGIRMALGARRGNILAMILGQGVRLALGGVVVGLLAALLLGRVLSSLLYGISAGDPATYAGVTALVLAVAAVACYLPARRATRIDPMNALRLE